MFRQTLLRVYWLPKHPVFWFTPFLNTVIQATSGYYSSLCSTCVTYGTPCHARGHQHLPPTLYCKCYWFERAFLIRRRFLPCTLSCSFQGLLGVSSLILKTAGLHANHVSCWLSRHTPSRTIASNHNNPQKRYIGRFYLCV